MKAESADLSRFDGMIGVLEGIAAHRRQGQGYPSDAMYYDLVAGYYRRVRQAHEDGRLVVAHSIMVPTELLLAMDLVPLHLECLATTLPPALKNYEELFAAARGYGLPAEVCSTHRVMAALFVKGWLPRPDVLIYSQQACDSSVKSGALLKELYGPPAFFLERPYRPTLPQAEYYARELAEMVAFLEQTTGRRLDMERLAQVMEDSRRQVALHRAIYRLRAVVPTPFPNRRGCQMVNVYWLASGSPEAVAYFQAVYDEARALVAVGKGAVAEERFRLMTLFNPPTHNWKLLDWLQKEHGASIVANPYYHHWGEWEYDPADPFKSLALKYFATPVMRQMHGPVTEAVADSVADAIAHRAEGAIYWANIGCPQTCAIIRTVRDALREQVGIPTLVLDCDYLDPSVVSEDDLKDKLESFLESLEAARS